MGFDMVVASAGPYANNLHLAPDIQAHQHLITQFLQAGCFSWRSTNSVKALKVFIKKYGNIFFIKQMLTHGCSIWPMWTISYKTHASVSILTIM